MDQNWIIIEKLIKIALWAIGIYCGVGIIISALFMTVLHSLYEREVDRVYEYLIRTERTMKREDVNDYLHKYYVYEWPLVAVRHIVLALENSIDW